MYTHTIAHQIDMKHWNRLLDTDIQKLPAAIKETKVFVLNIHARNL